MRFSSIGIFATSCALASASASASGSSHRDILQPAAEAPFQRAPSINHVAESANVNAHLRKVRKSTLRKPARRDAAESASLVKRQSVGPGGTQPEVNNADNLDTQMQTIVATDDPVSGAELVEKMPFVWNNSGGADMSPGDLIQNDNDVGQFKWVPDGTPFLQNPQAFASAQGGWNALPVLDNFIIEQLNITINGVVGSQPYYRTAQYDPNAIKRAVIVMPGKPRDSWKYTSLIYNALQVAVSRDANGNRLDPQLDVVNANEILIIGPAWLNQLDLLPQVGTTTDGQPTGGTQDTIRFMGSQWQSGGHSRQPASLGRSVTSYELLDLFIDMCMNKTAYPNLNQVVVAGHSMGGQMVQRYAVLKKTKPYDDNVRFWIGNPGSYAWLSTERPFPNATCNAATPVDDWIYGIYGNNTKITKYARKDVAASADAVVQRYQSRKVHYGYGLLDDGPGDTHCQALTQGGNHLDRGAHYVMMLGQLSGGFPATHTVDFIANVSHQDYPMLSTNKTIIHLFADDYDTRYPDLPSAVNPGDGTTSVTGGIKAFATPIHMIISSSLLLWSIVGVILAFTIMPCIFPVDRDMWESESWDVDAKRKLL